MSRPYRTSECANRTMRNTLKWLIGGSRGGENRLRIIRLLEDQPMNRNQIADELDLDYSTVQYHLDRLVEHNILENHDENYGKLFFLTEQMTQHMDLLDDIVEDAELEATND